MIWSFQVSWDRSDRERGRRREVEARWEKVLPGVGSSWAEKNNFDFMLDAWGDGAMVLDRPGLIPTTFQCFFSLFLGKLKHGTSWKAPILSFASYGQKYTRGKLWE